MVYDLFIYLGRSVYGRNEYRRIAGWRECSLSTRYNPVWCVLRIQN